jgi:hypothetical protein
MKEERQPQLGSFRIELGNKFGDTSMRSYSYPLFCGHGFDCLGGGSPKLLRGLYIVSFLRSSSPSERYFPFKPYFP